MSASIYLELIKQIQKHDYEMIHKTANEVLLANKEDVKAFQCKIIAYIYQERFDDALIDFNMYPGFAKDLFFEKAYCLYRANKIDDAFYVIESSPNKSKESSIELKAQIAYCQGRFQDSLSLYLFLVKHFTNKHDNKRRANIIANAANQVQCGKNVDITEFFFDISLTDSYDILFNMACYFINSRRFCEAERYLLAAEKFCMESYNEDTTQSELDKIKTIRIQLACCKHLQKKVNYALDIYKDILDKRMCDNEIVAVATNNTLAVNRNRNVFDLKKMIKVFQRETFISKLSPFQRKVVLTNLFQINAFNILSAEEALKTCDKFITDHPDNLDTAVLLKAAILMKNGDLETAIGVLLQEYLKSSTFSKLKMGLAMAQLYLNVGEYQKASEILKTLGEKSYHPGIISTLVTILMSQNDYAAASHILNSAIDWKIKNKGNLNELILLYDHTANLYLKRDLPQLAVDVLEKLMKLKLNDLKVLSKLTMAYAKINPLKAYDLCDQIRTNLVLSPEIDVKFLESSSWMIGLKTIKNATRVDSPVTTFLNKDKTNFKKKKSSSSKNHDPSVSLDPERWLPKHQKSNHKRKKDRRNNDVSKRTQRASSSLSDHIDISKKCIHAKPTQPMVDDNMRQQWKMKHIKKKKEVK